MSVKSIIRLHVATLAISAGLIHAAMSAEASAKAGDPLTSWNDADREWAYDRESHIGKLDKGLDEAAAKEWTVTSMKDDWRVIFPSIKND